MEDLFAGSSEEAWEQRLRKIAEEQERRGGEQPDDAASQAAPAAAPHGDKEHRPLADRLRPTTIENFIGQHDLVGPTAPLMQLIRSGRAPSMILWGPPGSGKTTLAQLVAQHTQADFVTLSAVTASVRDVRQVVDAAKSNLKFGRRTILFVDEIHRFSKSQQDAFLPHVESGIVTLIGATTENPSFSVIAPLLSRCRVYILKAHGEEDLLVLLQRGLDRINRDRPPEIPGVTADDTAMRTIARYSDGDARRALGLLELVSSVKHAANDDTAITHADIEAAAQRTLVYDKEGEEHYNIISALHKTIRSSDPHGAAYWMARMLDAGEEPLYVARRLVRMASEDIGLADPFALNHTMEALRTYQALGSPEGELALYQAAIYLAMAPKSNAVYTAANQARAMVRETGSLPVPNHLRNAPTRLMKDAGYSDGYTYDHDAPGHFAPKQGLPDALDGRRLYKPTDQGREKAHRDRLDDLDRRRDEERRERG